MGRGYKQLTRLYLALQTSTSVRSKFIQGNQYLMRGATGNVFKVHTYTWRKVVFDIYSTSPCLRFQPRDLKYTFNGDPLRGCFGKLYFLLFPVLIESLALLM